MSWVFVGTDFFSPKSSNAKYKTQGTSEANFGGKKPRIILREVRYIISLLTVITSFSMKFFIPNKVYTNEGGINSYITVCYLYGG